MSKGARYERTCTLKVPTVWDISKKITVWCICVFLCSCFCQLATVDAIISNHTNAGLKRADELILFSMYRQVEWDLTK